MLDVNALVIGILLLLSIVALLLSKYYSELSDKELKRQAQNGDSDKQILYQIVKNKDIALLYLRFFTILFISPALVLITLDLSTEVAILTVILTVVLLAIVIKYKFFSVKISKHLSPLILMLIIKTKPYVNGIAKFFSVPMTDSTSKIYELEDLVDLIDAQKNKSINRIDQNKLDLAVKALSFSDKQVKSLMIPKKEVRFLDSDEQISTILIDELHQTGLRHFPVFKDSKSNLIGVLDLDELVEKRMSGKVAWAVPLEVVDILETSSLQDALNLFLKTKQQLYIVLNQDKKIKGVLLIDDVLKALIG